MPAGATGENRTHNILFTREALCLFGATRGMYRIDIGGLGGLRGITRHTRKDLNLRPTGSKPAALSGLSYGCMFVEKY